MLRNFRKLALGKISAKGDDITQWAPQGSSMDLRRTNGSVAADAFTARGRPSAGATRGYGLYRGGPFEVSLRLLGLWLVMVERPLPARVLASTLRVVLLCALLTFACASSHPPFARAVQRVATIDCPEDEIEILSHREYASSSVYVLEACGRSLELEERVEVALQPHLSAKELAALSANLDPGRPPASVIAAVHGHAVSLCQSDSLARLQGPEQRQLSPKEMSAIEVEVASIRRSCASQAARLLGQDWQDDTPRWWFALGDRLVVAALRLGTVSCEHELPRDPACGGL